MKVFLDTNIFLEYFERLENVEQGLTPEPLNSWTTNLHLRKPLLSRNTEIIIRCFLKNIRGKLALDNKS